MVQSDALPVPSPSFLVVCDARELVGGGVSRCVHASSVSVSLAAKVRGREGMDEQFRLMRETRAQRPHTRNDGKIPWSGLATKNLRACA